jgi:hypothetical protein
MDIPGDLVVDLLTGSLAPITYDKYSTGMRRFTAFATKMVLPRYMQPSSTCCASLQNSPDHVQ